MQGTMERDEYHILVADDDRIIRASILQQLRGVLSDSYTLYEAHDGHAALDMLSRHPIGIVLTDMRMPRLDGLALVKQARNAWPDIQFAVLSNYDDFDYVKNAFQYGIIDYALKYETTGETLSALVGKVTEAFHAYEREQLFRARMRRSLLHSEACARGTQLAADLEACRAPALLSEMSGGPMRLLRADCLPDSSAPPEWRRLLSEWWSCAPLGDAEIYPYILPQHPESLRLRLGAFAHFTCANAGIPALSVSGMLGDFFAYAERQGCICLAAQTPFEAWDISLHFRLNELCRLLFYYDKSALLEEAPAIRGVVHAEEMLENFSRSLMEGDVDSALHYLHAAGKKLHAEWADPYAAREVLGKMLWEVYAIRRSDGRGDAESVQVAQQRLSTYTAFIEKTLFSHVMETQRPDGSGLDNLIHHITTHLSAPMSLDEAARSIGFSRAHFCRLFKQATGESYNTFLTRRRMEQASLLLRRSGASPRVVASAVGISDVRYFRKLFYQHMQVSVEDWMKGMEKSS